MAKKPSPRQTTPDEQVVQVQAPSVTELVALCEQQIDGLDARLADLIDKLAPVLLPDEGLKAKGVDLFEVGSPVQHRLQTLYLNLSSIQHSISELTKRVSA